MITEDYVSFKTAKLLKEKGFDWLESPFYSEQDRDEWWQNNNYTVPNEEYNPELPFDSETLTIVAPHVSIQMAMKWLREQYNIHFFVKYFGSIGWAFTIQKLKNESEHTIGEFYASYEKACEAAIEYCIENLI